MYMKVKVEKVSAISKKKFRKGSSKERKKISQETGSFMQGKE